MSKESIKMVAVEEKEVSEKELKKEEVKEKEEQVEMVGQDSKQMSEEELAEKIIEQHRNNEKPQVSKKEALNVGNNSPKEDFVIPREYVPLPSQGKIYPKNSNLHGADEVEIRHMTAQDEDILTSRSLLRSGRAIDALLKNCIMDNSVNPDNMLAGDRNAIMIALRVTGYGSDYPVDVECPECSSRTTHTFDLSKLNMKFLGAEPLDMGENLFDFTLPTSKKVVHFKLLTSIEEQKIAEEQEAIKKKLGNPVDTFVTTRLKSQIVSIDGNTDKRYINNFVNSMNVRDSREFRKYMSEIEPDIDMSQVWVCPSCGAKNEGELPIQANFFWPE